MIIKKTQQILIFNICILCYVKGYYKDMVWTGGPLHIEYEDSVDLWTSTGQYVTENIVVVKAITYNDKIYIMTPRFRRGVLATIWLVVNGKRGVELLPFPNIRAHAAADCTAVQNAVDVYLDHLGQLWILDSGIIETQELPRCMCSPKVVVVSIILGIITKTVELDSLTEPTSQLQNVVVEYDISGKTFAYVSDASRGAVLVYDTAADCGWLVLACAPASGLQLALFKQKIGHSILILVRLDYQGLLELDTAVLKRKNSETTLRVVGDHMKSVTLLGSDSHHIYMRHIACTDVLSWDTRHPFNATRLKNIHSAGPNLTPTSVSADPLKPTVIVLDSNYGDAVFGHLPTYHRISYIV